MALSSLRTLAAGIDRDIDAVVAGLTLPWSSGAVEGHVNRVIKGGLDNVTDEELARLDVHRDEDEAGPAVLPLRRDAPAALARPAHHRPDAAGTLPACDAHRPAARALIDWRQDTDRDPEALPQIFEDWETEALYARGWARVPQPEAPCGPAAHLSLAPREQD
ncbi:hypothetical protein ACFV5J_10325 [Streptomyces zaomyceticus]|uniref:hypothetical protein n=1 Tax=Streptomyces zaomyceticus TaxID=68286 RepID=UPI00364E330C